MPTIAYEKFYEIKKVELNKKFGRFYLFWADPVTVAWLCTNSS